MCYCIGRMRYAVSISPAANAARREARPPNGPMGSATLAQSAFAGPTADRADPVKPSQAQSCLVVPSPTFNFPLPERASIGVTRSIRGICAIRGGKNPPNRAHSCAFVAASICAHLCASVAPTQYGLIRPNTALNCFMTLAFLTFCQPFLGQIRWPQFGIAFFTRFSYVSGAGGTSEVCID
jgi:hypothetical protein